MNALKYLTREYGICDEKGKNYFLDYLVRTKDGKYAIEEKGVNYHHPQIIGEEKYRKQLKKQNTCTLWGIKLYRFSIEDCAFGERIEDDIKQFLGMDTSKFIDDGLKIQRKVELYEHQKISLEEIKSRRRAGIKAFLIVLPTASGKSRIVEEDIRDFAKDRKTFKALILAPGIDILLDWKKRIEMELPELVDKIEIRTYVYNPIVELTTDDVWDVLLRCDGGRTPWGSDNSELVSLYADADSGECPFAGIHAGGQTQSCGNSRFGCWVCTVVKEDKSLNGFIKSGHRELIPLAEFRSWLMSIRDNEEYREKKRRNGTVYRDKQGNMGFGPFNWKARKLILRKLLETQQVMGYELITLDELKAIDEIWDQELDLSRRVLVELHEEITGERLPWYDYKEPLIDNETVVELENLAQKNNVPEELIRNLLLSVYRNKNYSNQKILRDGIDRLLNQQWLHYEIIEEIENENQ